MSMSGKFIEGPDISFHQILAPFVLGDLETETTHEADSLACCYTSSNGANVFI